MPTDEIVPPIDVVIAARRQSLLQRKAKTPIEAVRALASMQRRPQPVLSTVTDHAPVMLIGQIKYQMAETGALIEGYDPVATALLYVQAGADAVALFTDETLYQRGLDDMVLVARAISQPVINQDYVLDEYQVVEARAAGASALVLHAAVVDQQLLRKLISATHRNRMTAIVEVRDPDELEYAISLSPYVIGIRGHNDEANEFDLDRVCRLRELVPAGMRIMITDGLKTLGQVASVVKLGVDAVVVREHILKDDDQVRQLDSLLKRDSGVN